MELTSGILCVQCMETGATVPRAHSHGSGERQLEGVDGGSGGGYLRAEAAVNAVGTGEGGGEGGAGAGGNVSAAAAVGAEGGGGGEGEKRGGGCSSDVGGVRKQSRKRGRDSVLETSNVLARRALPVCYWHTTHNNALQHSAMYCNALQQTQHCSTEVVHAQQVHDSHKTHCNTLQHTATHCSTLQRIAAYCNPLQPTAAHCSILQHIAIHHNALQCTCNTLQHTATHYTPLQRTAPYCNALQNSAPHGNTRQHTAAHCSIDVVDDAHTSRRSGNTPATHCNALQHTTTHYNTLQHTARTPPQPSTLAIKTKRAHTYADRNTHFFFALAHTDNAPHRYVCRASASAPRTDVCRVTRTCVSCHAHACATHTCMCNTHM